MDRAPRGTRVALFVHVILVVVNAVAVAGHRRIAKEERCIDGDARTDAARNGRRARRRRVRYRRPRRWPSVGFSINQILLLDQCDSPAVANRMSYGDEQQAAARPGLFLADARDQTLSLVT